MIVEISSILDRYGLNMSIWYPTGDLSSTKEKETEEGEGEGEEWGDIFQRMPRYLRLLGLFEKQNRHSYYRDLRGITNSGLFY